MEEAKITFRFEDAAGGTPATPAPGGSAPKPSSDTQKIHDTIREEGAGLSTEKKSPKRRKTEKPTIPDSGAKPASEKTDQEKGLTDRTTKILDGIAGGAEKIGLKPLADVAAKGAKALSAEAGAAITSGLSAVGVSPGLAAAAGAAAGPVGLAVAAVGAAAMAVKKIDQTAQQFMAGAEADIGTFSPEVAQARARATVRDIMRRQERAARLGDEVAANIETNSRISAATTTIKDIVAEPLLQEYNDIKKGVAFLTELAAAGTKKASPVIQEIIRLHLLAMLPPPAHLLKGAGKLGDMFEPPKPPDFLGWFERQEHLKAPPPFTDTGMTTDTAKFDIPGLSL